MRRFWVAAGVVGFGALLVGVAQGPSGTGSATARSFAPPESHTGAPGELTCTECHTAGSQLGGSLAIQNVPANYTPGQVYPITVQIQRTGQQRWGFELVPIRDSSGVNVMAGRLTATSNTTILQSGIISGKQRIYVSHFSGIVDGTFAGTANGPVSWTFNWTAPQAGTGAVTFYAAGNAADGLGSPTGDVIYTTTATSAEAPVTAASDVTWGKIKALYLGR